MISLIRPRRDGLQTVCYRIMSAHPVRADKFDKLKPNLMRLTQHVTDPKRLEKGTASLSHRGIPAYMFVLPSDPHSLALPIQRHNSIWCDCQSVRKQCLLHSKYCTQV